MITPDQAATFERCMAVGGVALFGADTVYGLACDPGNDEAVRRLYAIKRRRPDRPAAVMFFSRELALAALPEVGPRTVAGLEALLPGGVTVLLPNPLRRYPLACGPDPDAPLGLRVPALGPAAAGLAAVRWPVLQSSANLSGEPEARRLEDVAAVVRDDVDLVLDAGELAGRASTVIDLRRYEDDGHWEIVREGAVSPGCVEAALGALG
ncbi:L-threonylcarbamoyladenylate synthase [Baekduia soli]|uniref:L-threonylcarbamoyladenylate synthase n=1 Tax=Baekduia soli TaxID=496014 RepID=A0A5B8U3U5_9ACTN|nr:L-threonylcarbamoyladenylate synthase [Baekduia soli]QEC47714.1 L-threonylcarbamoyladenylate synthase [Baekduia soli]